MNKQQFAAMKAALEVIPADKLRILATYIDRLDLIMDYEGTENDVQKDLRRMADLSEIAMKENKGHKM